MLTPEAALQILKDLYESEIDWSICTWWDGGYFATLGQSADLIEAGAKPRRLEGETSLAHLRPSFTAFRLKKPSSGCGTLPFGCIPKPPSHRNTGACSSPL